MDARDVADPTLSSGRPLRGGEASKRRDRAHFALTLHSSPFTTFNHPPSPPRRERRSASQSRTLSVRLLRRARFRLSMLMQISVKIGLRRRIGKPHRACTALDERSSRSLDCVERGYLLLPVAQRHLSAGERVIKVSASSR